MIAVGIYMPNYNFAQHWTRQTESQTVDTLKLMLVTNETVQKDAYVMNNVHIVIGLYGTIVQIEFLMA